MFVIWRHQPWSYAIRWKINEWLQNFLGKAADGCVKDGHQKQHHQGCVSLSACVACQRKQERQIHKDFFSWFSRTPNSASVASMDLGCIWPSFNLSLAWAGSGTRARIPLLHSHIFVTAGGGGGCVIWGLARYTALVTVLASRQGFLFGSQLKRTMVRQRTEGCVWASVCVRLRKSLEKWAAKKVKALSKWRKSHNAEAIRSRQQSTLSHSCCVTAVVNNLT